jgi:fumarate reductase flavoprotein subunit
MRDSTGIRAIAAFLILAFGAVPAYPEAKSLPTAERHKAYGVKCEDCHGSKDKKQFDHKQCLSCHESYEKVAERTKKLARNPHKSHYGEIECNACHHGHKADEYLCAQCHQD